MTVSQIELANRLRTFDLFDTLTPDELSSVAAMMTVRIFTRGSFVVAERQLSNRNTYFIIGGKIRVCAYSEDGRQVQFEDLLDGAMFGELSAIDGLPRSSDCIALVDTTLAALPAPRFFDIRCSHPAVAEALVRRLTAMVRRQMGKVFEFSTTTVNHRIRLELLRMASENRKSGHGDGPIVFDDAPTHADLAARISTHREAVTRELKSLESLGIIDWRRDRHAVLDLARLTEVSHGRS